jgi:hypothetical protein
LNIVNTKTAAKVPIMEAGLLGEKERHVKTEIIRKYILAALLN